MITSDDVPQNFFDEKTEADELNEIFEPNSR